MKLTTIKITIDTNNIQKIIAEPPKIDKRTRRGKTGKLASLNRSWQSKEGTFCALGMAGIEPTPSKSECDWTPLSPKPLG